MFKDTFLTVSLLIVVGGPKAVLLYPTQFTSVVVLGQAASIIVPLFMSGLHLALYNPYILLNGLNSRRIVAMIICIMCSFIAPITIIVTYQHAKEKMKMIVRNYNSNNQDINRKVMGIAQKYEKLKNQLTEFYRIELGMYHQSFIKVI